MFKLRLFISVCRHIFTQQLCLTHTTQTQHIPSVNKDRLCYWQRNEEAPTEEFCLRAKGS